MLYIFCERKLVLLYLGFCISPQTLRGRTAPTTANNRVVQIIYLIVEEKRKNSKLFVPAAKSKGPVLRYGMSELGSHHAKQTSDVVLASAFRKLAMGLSDRLKRTKQYRGFSYRRGFLAFCFFVFFFITVLQWIVTIHPPPPDVIPHLPCRDATEGYVLHEMGICTDACGKLCFPRVRGICFGHSEVTVCDGQPPIPEEIKEGGGSLPSVMRFYMEKPRKKVAVRHGVCPGWNSSARKPIEGVRQAHWVRGLQMVADLTLMPTGRVGPNPHHESEKVVPAILLSHLYGLENSTFYWFADPKDPRMISKWSLGLLEVFSNHTKVQFLRPAAKNQGPICFEDAIVFAGGTNSGYMPNVVAHDWFRKTILEHCRVPVVDANRPVEDALIIHRPNSSRNFANYEVIKEVLGKELHVPVKLSVPGPWEFCEQVRLVAEADIVLTPHGSQNANLVALRPGAVVMEVFPFLYYIDWYSHYLHAGRVKHYELYGTYEDGSMPLLMRIYSLLYGWKGCFLARHCMNYGKNQKIHADINKLESLLQTLTSHCRIVVKGSQCLHKSPH